MNVEASHPAAAQLKAFGHGKLEDEAASTVIAAHLDTCLDCQHKLEALSGDTLENLVHCASTSPAAGDNDESVPECMEYFRIERVLGRGGMGTVYLAHDTRLHRPVALKTLQRELAIKPGAKERFLREARAAAALAHDHIIPIYYVGETAGTPFLAMPLLKGMPLDEQLKQAGGKLAPAAAVRIAGQVAAGLAAAHERGLIHRDIKPSNIWIEPEQGGRVKILDFGLAKTGDGGEALTQSGSILGTPAYMAPEQARGEAVDGRADLFSLGCVLYEMLIGRRPFAGRDTMAILTSLVHHTPAAPHTLNSDCSPELSGLVMRLLEKDPAKRLESAEAVMAVLATLSPSTTPALPSAVEQSSQRGNSSSPATAAMSRQPRRHTLVAAAVGLLLFIGGGVLLPQIMIRITGKDGKVREIEVQPGEKVEIVQQPADETPKPSPPVSGDPDRRAAEYILALGGKARLNGQRADIANVAKLPKESFQLTGVQFGADSKVTDAGLAYLQGCKDLKYLRVTCSGISDAGLAHFQGCHNLTYLGLEGTRVTDAGLANFQGCKNLTQLWLGGTEVTDAGLAHFQSCKDLTYLILGGTRVTDAGLAHFEGCKKLTHLSLAETRVTDAGLVHFEGCQNLTYIYLRSTRVSDAGLAYFQGCKNLTALNLVGTQVTDAGLAYLQGCKNLTILDLVGTRVTDAGLVHFEGCKKLSELHLRNTQVSDAGLAYFKHCKNLTNVDLADTQVSDAGLRHLEGLQELIELNLSKTKASQGGIAALQKALPKCRFIWDGGLFEPLK